MEMIASVLLELRAKANKEMVCFGTRLLSSIFLCVSSSDIFVFLWGGGGLWSGERKRWSVWVGSTEVYDSGLYFRHTTVPGRTV